MVCDGCDDGDVGCERGEDTKRPDVQIHVGPEHEHGYKYREADGKYASTVLGRCECSVSILRKWRPIIDAERAGWWRLLRPNGQLAP